jgi:hypothetical protein
MDTRRGARRRGARDRGVGARPPVCGQSAHAAYWRILTKAVSLQNLDIARVVNDAYALEAIGQRR